MPCYNTANRLVTFFYFADAEFCQQNYVLPLLPDLVGDKFCPSHACRSELDLRLIEAWDLYFQEVLRNVVGALSNSQQIVFVWCVVGIAALFSLCRSVHWESCFGSRVALQTSAVCGEYVWEDLCGRGSDGFSLGPIFACIGGRGSLFCGNWGV